MADRQLAAVVDLLAAQMTAEIKVKRRHRKLFVKVSRIMRDRYLPLTEKLDKVKRVAGNAMAEVVYESGEASLEALMKYETLECSMEQIIEPIKEIESKFVHKDFDLDKFTRLRHLYAEPVQDFGCSHVIATHDLGTEMPEFEYDYDTHSVADVSIQANFTVVSVRDKSTQFDAANFA